VIGISKAMRRPSAQTLTENAKNASALSRVEALGRGLLALRQEENKVAKK
jgi:hypothetical protein